MISFRESPDIEYNGTENCAVMKLFADTSSELTGVTHFDGILLLHGSSAYVIETGETYMLNGADAWILQPSQNVFSNVYTKSEIDGMITEIYGIIAYYHTTLVSDTGEITFYSLGGNVGTWAIYGNGQQNGTPTPDNPVMPTFCGTLDSTDWTIPITCAGQTVPVYLGQTQTVRRIKKLMLTGDEDIDRYVVSNTVGFAVKNLLDVNYNRAPGICTHYVVDTRGWIHRLWIGVQNKTLYFVSIGDVLGIDTATEFKSYLAAQYAAGTPVTVWYALAEPTTGIVNEPLCKIGTYADELHSEDAAVTIPTVKGQNTLTVETKLPPSKIIISGE